MDDIISELSKEPYEEYVPAKKRKLNRREELLKSAVGLLVPKNDSIHEEVKLSEGSSADECALEPVVPSKSKDSEETVPARSGKSLLVESHRLRYEAQKNQKDQKLVEIENLRAEEERILDQVSKNLSAPLTNVRERAKGIVYTTRMKHHWSLPEKYQKVSKEEADATRDKFFIDLSGQDAPPPILSFKDMCFPEPILRQLEARQVVHPTQIQMQGIPAVLLGRDLIGIAFTGSGKTIVFSLPMIMGSLDAELRLPFEKGEGPWGLVVCPSRELASQTHDTVARFCGYLKDDGFPALKTICMIGGTDVMQQTHIIRQGIHMVIATPGRLNDILNKRRMSLTQCKFLCFDEADRMIDLGFEDDVRNVLDNFRHQRQTLLFSATMPRKIQEFAKSALVDPIVVNVGRAGAANLDVLQEVEYVKQEAKLPYLLECLQKTGPPVLVFCENKKDVDDVQEYLLLKGVDVVSIHGGLSQDERQQSIQEFRIGKKDVLVGTDVASKGLDFPAIQHVINFDMPKEIENYVHRIGRTGRCGRTGIATTFINKNQEQTILLDLKALLIEAKQRIPPFLEALNSKDLNFRDIGGIRGCAYCSGLGHRIAECPKLESQKAKQLGSTSRDFLNSGNRYGGTQGYTGDW